MRNRHLPRVCRQCHAPMASGADGCWRCGVQWATEDQPRPTLRLIAGGKDEDRRSDIERWTNEGGTYRAEAALAAEAAARR